MNKTYNALFLCTGNSARSIMAECVLNRLGRGRFTAYSAGSQPNGEVNPFALDLLRRFGYDVSGLRSKSWEDFSGDDAPVMDFVFTVCDNAAAEVCPIWPGQPMSAHWGFRDPAGFQGSPAETAAVFAEVYGQIERRIGIFVNLPMATLDKLSLQQRIDEIGAKAPAEI